MIKLTVIVSIICFFTAHIIMKIFNINEIKREINAMENFYLNYEVIDEDNIVALTNYPTLIAEKIPA